MTSPVVIRDAESPEDWTFIRRAWSVTQWTGTYLSAGADKDHYFAEMGRLFSAIVPVVRARMAIDPEDADNRLGFAVYDGDALWFVYVMQVVRRLGIVPALLSGLDIRNYNQMSIQGVRRLKPKDRGWKFTPRFTLEAP